MDDIRKVYDVFDNSFFKFANTDAVYRRGEIVQVKGKEYEIYEFYQSVHADENVVDWLLLRRFEDGVAWWLNANPSEIEAKLV